MKKCYVVPSFEVVNYELSNMVCTSPTFEVNESGTEATVGGVTDAPVLGEDDEFDARQRGGDFGSLW